MRVSLHYFYSTRKGIMEKVTPFVCPVCGEKIPTRKAWFLSVDSVVTCIKCRSRLKPEGAGVQKISFILVLFNSIIGCGGGFLLSHLAGLWIGVLFMVVLLLIVLWVFRYMNIKTVVFTASRSHIKPMAKDNIH